MAYTNQCGSCEEFTENGRPYDTSNSDYIKGYCSWYRCYYYPNESCNHYRKRGSVNGCYITTILCNRLGLSDDCDELNTLRSFRDNVLQKDEQYCSLLCEYDVVGPKIAEKLQTEEVDVIQRLFKSYICPIVHFIKEKKCEKAVENYSVMTKSLEDYYGLSFDVRDVENYDYSKGGHGKLKKIRN